MPKFSIFVPVFFPTAIFLFFDPAALTFAKVLKTFYQERQRDWPFEALATLTFYSKYKKVPIPTRF